MARFISADPEIQDPTCSQCYNRFSYVINNPTNLTDPTGYEWEDYIPVYGNIGPFRDAVGDGHFGTAALYGGMAIFDGATLGIGSILDAPLKAGLKAGIKAEVRREAAEQVSKQAVEQAARVTEQAAKVSEQTVAKEGQVAEKAESKASRPSEDRTSSTESTPSKNKNSNDAAGNFGVYEIHIDGELEKIGKADLERVTQSSGQPTRLHQQVRKLEDANPAAKVEGKVVEDGHATTGEAKKAETKRLQDHFDKTGEVPKGNEKSFKPQPKDPKLDGGG